ncbi:4-coumarate--CoA ligase 2 [Cajanus cajan]|uniref:4-coumarate--CoA ligase 2 n=1 Tax=Cajanus cajan TaxID=3821 RepID=A0A151TLV4_CAJCA|nr:4-coumarate--CoA ligase 2 [Cajanus cajan]KYP68010.1 4-coumarate--CoA ligase 2 [Cajanus cajan]
MARPTATAHIFKSKLPDIPLPNNVLLHTYCFQKLPEIAHRPCLIAGDRTYSYAETHLLSRKVAAGMSKLGVRKGDVVMILLPNSPEFIFSFMAVSMLGAVATSANPFYTAAEISKYLAACKPTLAVTEAATVHKLDMGWGLKAVVTVEEPAENCVRFWDVAAADEKEAPAVEIFWEDAVALPFSSGTTGVAKGVVLTHKSLMTSVAQMMEGENPNLYMTEEDVILCVLPLFHIFAMHCVMMCGLRAGSAILLIPQFEIRALLEAIERHRVTVAMVVPPLIIALTKNPALHHYDLTSIRFVMSGAAPLGLQLQEALANILPNAIVGQGYGMTESGPVLSMCLGFAKKPLPTKVGSCGTVVRNAELKVIEPQTGFSLPRNHPGEICVRGPQIMKGYLNNPQATAAMIDAHGWLHTGDIGYVDDDDHIFLVERLKELIKFKGFQVPPAELEDLLMSHPSIADAAVVPQKDDVAGELPVAFVVSFDLTLTEEAVKDFIAKQVVFYKRLHKVHFVHAIPKSITGKILRKDLVAKIASIAERT